MRRAVSLGRARFALGLALATWVAAAGLGPAPAAAQDYPTRSIELIVPFVPGGGTDLVGRSVADHLTKKWGQPVLVVRTRCDQAT